METVRCYIAGQEAHYRKLTFQEEFLALLKVDEIEYDERYIWK
jgi:putative transposase